MGHDSFTKEQFLYLLQRHRQGIATPKEERLLRSYYDLFEQEPDVLESFSDAARANIYQRLEARLFAPDGTPRERPIGKRRFTRWFPYAAAILLVISVAGYFWVSQTPDRFQEITATAVQPGGHRATLTLADGRIIDLSEQQSGIVVGDGVTYQDGSAVLEASDSDRSITPTEYTLATPKGGTYQVTLPDGTQVWLNAESILTYPSRFAADQRRVEISGEAYFSVTHDVERPFRVVSRGQEITVLGTQFNVSAYPEEKHTETTLVEGKVQLQATASGTQVSLLPGQQGRLLDGQIDVQKVDLAPVIAWQKGYFHFSGNLESVMQQIARWYDLDVVFQDESLKQKTVFGRVFRDRPLSEVLILLEEVSAVTFSVKADGNERRIEVMK